VSGIFVTNRNEFLHVDSYDGVEYAFNPGEKVLVPEPAARHMLGFGAADKTETLVRLGWHAKIDPAGKRGWVEDPDGVRKLANFVFTKGVMVEVSAEEDPLAPAEVAAPRPVGRPRVRA